MTATLSNTVLHCVSRLTTLSWTWSWFNNIYGRLDYIFSLLEVNSYVFFLVWNSPLWECGLCFRCPSLNENEPKLYRLPACLLNREQADTVRKHDACMFFKTAFKVLAPLRDTGSVKAELLLPVSVRPQCRESCQTLGPCTKTTTRR